ncbi:t-SNARE [Rickenella mellea]|uniref:t-SNARE n=1 Tax=Rickenella mellea TaxID=50990 RepID=A0A4Y7Q5S7_9AGAM|nr:t-SNARE [Rickenella mellea]
MSRDRLRELRAQRAGTSTGQTYELSNVNHNDNSTNVKGKGKPDNDSSAAFYEEISTIQDEIKSFNANVARISELRTRSLNNFEPTEAASTTAQLDELVSNTRAISTDLKSRIQALAENVDNSTKEGQNRREQVILVKGKFREAIENYQREEQQYRAKYRDRAERQYKIVKPDASPEEISAAVDDEQGGQIFSQALLNSTRYGESRTAYREVQERHEDIKKITRTLGELNELFNDMTQLVIVLGETIDGIGQTAEGIKDNVSAGLDATEKAKISAARARKLRWVCFGIIVLILAVLAIILGVVFGRK